ncbi:hypothetical protein ACSBR1_012397 [Camellia fascicularis]
MDSSPWITNDKLTKAHGEIIGNRIGKLVCMEALSEGLILHRNFLCIRVEMNVTKPLLQGCPANGENGAKVFYKYEKFTKFCYDCDPIGPDNVLCKFMTREEGKSSSYGLEMRMGIA